MCCVLVCVVFVRVVVDMNTGPYHFPLLLLPLLFIPTRFDRELEKMQELVCRVWGILCLLLSLCIFLGRFCCFSIISHTHTHTHTHTLGHEMRHCCVEGCLSGGLRPPLRHPASWLHLLPAPSSRDPSPAPKSQPQVPRGKKKFMSKIQDRLMEWEKRVEGGWGLGG